MYMYPIIMRTWDFLHLPIIEVSRGELICTYTCTCTCARMYVHVSTSTHVHVHVHVQCTVSIPQAPCTWVWLGLSPSQVYTPRPWGLPPVQCPLYLSLPPSHTISPSPSFTPSLHSPLYTLPDLQQITFAGVLHACDVSPAMLHLSVVVLLFYALFFNVHVHVHVYTFCTCITSSLMYIVCTVHMLPWTGFKHAISSLPYMYMYMYMYIFALLCLHAPVSPDSSPVLLVLLPLSIVIGLRLTLSGEY